MHFSFYKRSPFKNLPKFHKIKKLAKFFDKIKMRFFFYFFFKRCLNHSSKGTKNNEENISSSFREIEKSLKKFTKKKWVMILAKYFEKKNIPIFFCEYSKRCADPYILGNGNN